jgi:hypothetical protein
VNVSLQMTALAKNIMIMSALIATTKYLAGAYEKCGCITCNSEDCRMMLLRECEVCSRCTCPLCIAKDGEIGLDRDDGCYCSNCVG